jgi:putative DNA primase/helicase
MVDIPIREGVIRETHGKSAGDFAMDLKKAAGRFYGTAGPEFLERLIRFKPDTQALQHWIQGEVDALHKDLADGKQLESFQERVLHRFAVVLCGSLLAVDFGILPFERTEVIDTVFAIRDIWLGDEGSRPDAVRGLQSVRDFILTHRSRFRDADNDNIFIRDLAGYTDREGRLFMFTTPGFREACKGYDVESVLAELDARRYLFKNEAPKLRSRHTSAGAGRPRLYAVRSDLLEDDV